MTAADPAAKAAAYLRLDAPSAPWGDYGHILVHGMTAYEARGADGQLRLFRTGPFIDPITLPGLGDTLVTERLRAPLARSFPGLEFRAVTKAMVVEVNWHRWDRDAVEPRHYPRGGEPEDYVLAGRHSESVAKMLGALWELVPGVTAAAHYRLKGFTRLVSPELAEWLRRAVPQLVSLPLQC